MLHRTIAMTILAGLAGSASAGPVDGRYYDVDNCDRHDTRRATFELGESSAFPDECLIESNWAYTSLTACPASDDPGMRNVLVKIANLTGRDWKDLFYVADPETSLSNFDGFAVSAAVPTVRTYAFRIDFLDNNRNLVYESMTPDGVFEAGETWVFIIQDYTNSLGLPPSFGSVDFSGASAGDVRSSGSIVQFVIPLEGDDLTDIGETLPDSVPTDASVLGQAQAMIREDD